MKYVLKHKKYGTYYCFDKFEKYKYFKVDIEKAYVFNRPQDAGRIRNKLKHPENWIILEVKNG